MRILVTGAKGFVGKNLCFQLKNIRDNKIVAYKDIIIDDVFEYDVDSSQEQLDEWCRTCDFVFNLAGINRPENKDDFKKGNRDFTENLLRTLSKNKNLCPVLLSSSIQASLCGRFANSLYGISKKNAEELIFKYSEKIGIKPYVYRFPNLFGKWCRPNYNSVIATFCYNIANDLPIQINDRNTELNLLYIDDLVSELIEALKGGEHRCDYDGINIIPSKNGKYCYCPNTYNITLGEIADMLYGFANQPVTLNIPEMPENSFIKKLYSTYLSYLPKHKIAFPLKMNIDARGSFTELIHTHNCGQLSVNISKPGITKGQHWHNSKWEFFIVVYGHALIQQRRIDTDEVIEFYVSGENMKCVHMLPGYTHNIINLSKTENLVTVMYCNENFDPEKPDTYYCPVE